MKSPKLQVVGIEEGKEAQIKSPENIFNKIIKEIFPSLRNELPIKLQKHMEQ